MNSTASQVDSGGTHRQQTGWTSCWLRWRQRRVERSQRQPRWPQHQRRTCQKRPITPHCSCIELAAAQGSATQQARLSFGLYVTVLVADLWNVSLDSTRLGYYNLKKTRCSVSGACCILYELIREMAVQYLKECAVSSTAASRESQAVRAFGNFRLL